MKFKAKIKYSPVQSMEAKKFGDRNSIDTEVEFTFADLLTPNFTIREIVIPWLKDGNFPEIIE